MNADERTTTPPPRDIDQSNEGNGIKTFAYRTHPAILANIPLELSDQVGAKSSGLLSSADEGDQVIGRLSLFSAAGRVNCSPTRYAHRPQDGGQESRWPREKDGQQEVTCFDGQLKSRGAEIDSMVISEPERESLMKELDLILDEYLSEEDKLNLAYYLNKFASKNCDLSELLANLLQNLLSKLPSSLMKYKLLNLVKKLYLDCDISCSRIICDITTVDDANTKRQLDLRLFEAMIRRYLMASSVDSIKSASLTKTASLKRDLLDLQRKRRRQRRAIELDLQRRRSSINDDDRNEDEDDSDYDKLIMRNLSALNRKLSNNNNNGLAKSNLPEAAPGDDRCGQRRVFELPCAEQSFRRPQLSIDFEKSKASLAEFESIKTGVCDGGRRRSSMLLSLGGGGLSQRQVADQEDQLKTFTSTVNNDGQAASLNPLNRFARVNGAPDERDDIYHQNHLIYGEIDDREEVSRAASIGGDMHRRNYLTPSLERDLSGHLQASSLYSLPELSNWPMNPAAIISSYSASYQQPAGEHRFGCGQSPLLGLERKLDATHRDDLIMTPHRRNNRVNELSDSAANITSLPYITEGRPFDGLNNNDCLPITGAATEQSRDNIPSDNNNNEERISLLRLSTAITTTTAEDNEQLELDLDLQLERELEQEQQRQQHQLRQLHNGLLNSRQQARLYHHHHSQETYINNHNNQSYSNNEIYRSEIHFGNAEVAAAADDNPNAYHSKLLAPADVLVDRQVVPIGNQYNYHAEPRCCSALSIPCQSQQQNPPVATSYYSQLKPESCLDYQQQQLTPQYLASQTAGAQQQRACQRQAMNHDYFNIKQTSSLPASPSGACYDKLATRQQQQQQTSYADHHQAPDYYYREQQQQQLAARSHASVGRHRRHRSQQFNHYQTAPQAQTHLDMQRQLQSQSVELRDYQAASPNYQSTGSQVRASYGQEDGEFSDDTSIISVVAAPAQAKLSVSVAEQMKEQANNFVNNYNATTTGKSRKGKGSPSSSGKSNLQVRRTLKVKIKKSKPILGIAIEGGFNVSGQLLPRIVCVHLQRNYFNSHSSSFSKTKIH